MAPARPLESHTETLCREIALRQGHLLIKLHHSMAGFPDRLLIRDGKTDMYVEFKRPGERPTLIQKYWHERLRDMGKHVMVITSAAEFRIWLTEAT